MIYLDEQLIRAAEITGGVVLHFIINNLEQVQLNSHDSQFRVLLLDRMQVHDAVYWKRVNNWQNFISQLE